MKWVRYGLRETASKGRQECMDSCRIDVSEELGRYRPSLARARSLRSDRPGRMLGRYVATERDVCSVATYRQSLARTRLLRSDRAWLELGRYIATLRPFSGFSPMSRVSSAVLFSFELAFQCHRFEVNQHPVAEVMPVVLRSGQYASREEAVEKRNVCRSMQNS
ncbi:hypothetical protein F2Q69_00005489 [Brassica cretica]|uniref:Uncharacterized protein n=1 Tax=Brassica cretica TaxID=69181 RepID=A0A8S9P803_BRACR|nr:hypothetical protein F2Q69_00005489 [Brassica cretica]